MVAKWDSTSAIAEYHCPCLNTTPPAPRYYTFWSINGPLQRDRLRRQLADFKAAGLHGVVFHPRYYCGIPPYLSDEYLEHVTDTIRHARELGLRFWLYDENGWPSGTGDGKVLAKYPDSGAVRLDLSRERTPKTSCSPPKNAAGLSKFDCIAALALSNKLTQVALPVL